MATLKCAFPHDGYSFGDKIIVDEKTAERLCAPDPFSRITFWGRVAGTKPAAPAEVEVVAEKAPEAPVIEEAAPAPAEVEAPVAEAPKAPAKGKAK